MKIVVAAGGNSTERDVSLVSGKNVYKALKKNGHKVILLDVFYGYNAADAKNPEALFDTDREWDKDINDIAEADPDIESLKEQRPDHSNAYFGPNVIEICRCADIVFLALHGGAGENGKVQAAFDIYDIKYTGSGYLSSALAMDKYFSKILFQTNNIPTPNFVLVKDNGDTDPVMPFPCVVKTRAGGSSVGVYLVNDKNEYEKALKDAFMYGDDVLVEEYIKGHDYTVAVVDGKAYPIVDIAPVEGFYDYKNKYQAGKTVEVCPADLPPLKTRDMQEIAVRVFEVLEIDGYARMDFVMAENGKMYCLEANTLPGMTKTSLVPLEAKTLGISFGDLCEKIIKVSLKKYEAKK
ncbi:MAG: D-alanine--D-alanine ligase [Lachnospiraceae bacterium]|nr:D-alanine--D-alanine ligase [Lachnospiraceae bacterium]